MTMIDEDSHLISLGDKRRVIDQAELAAVAFLARYSGRTLDAYRHDLRNRRPESRDSTVSERREWARRWDGVRRSQDPSGGPSRLNSSRRRDCRRDPRLPHNEHPRRRRRAAAGRDIRRR